MGDLINLNKARKARARGDAKAVAAANRVRHGRTKLDSSADKAERERASRNLDGSRLDVDPARD